MPKDVLKLGGKMSTNPLNHCYKGIQYTFTISKKKFPYSFRTYSSAYRFQMPRGPGGYICKSNDKVINKLFDTQSSLIVHSSIQSLIPSPFHSHRSCLRVKNYLATGIFNIFSNYF